MNKLFEKSFSKGIFQVFDDQPEKLDLLAVHQTHSDIILTENEYQDCEADGLIFSYQALGQKALAIKTADCLPILYLGETHVALVHAGWRGVYQQIHTDQKLRAIHPQKIFIGPCIHVRHFEVQPDFVENFPSSSNFITQDNKLYFDLVLETMEQLQATFPDAEITDSGICTFENNNYNSYRRNKTTQRNWNLFKIRG